MSNDISEPPPVIPNRVNGLKCYRYSRSRLAWRHVSARDRKLPAPSHIKIVTWNVDCMNPHVDERMVAVLEHLQSRQVLGYLRDDGSESDTSDEDEEDEELKDAPPLCCILLQEVHESALAVILQDDWVRKHFIVVPISQEKWPEGAVYGNVTLVSKYLQVEKAQIVEYGISNMQRSAVMVDVRMQSRKGKRFTLRVGNTHLESLVQGTEARPRQISVAMNLLKQKEVDGGILAGDMNTIGARDEGLGESFGLQDSWQRQDEDGYTWGFQGGTENGKHPPGRLDKIYVWPSRKRKYFATEPRLIGVGVKADPFEGGEGLFASDHYGLLNTVYVYQ